MTDRLPDEVAIDPVTERDLPGLNRLTNDPAVARYLDLAPPVSLDRTVDFFRYIREQEGAWWALRVGGDLAGSVGLIPADPSSRLGHTASLFVYLDPAWWGRGLGRRAVEAMVERGGSARARPARGPRGRRERALAPALPRRAVSRARGVRRDGFRGDDGYRDLIQLARILR